MKTIYKNVPLPQDAHAIIKEEAWKSRTSISKFLSNYAYTFKGKKLTK